MLRILLALLAIPLITACAGPEKVKFDLEEATARWERDVANFERAQAWVERTWPVPQRLDFDEGGSVFIDRIALVGRAGKANLRLHFTWVNTAGKSYPVVDVKLTLRDLESDHEWSDSLEMRLPFKHQLTPNSSYTSWFDTPTHGLYLKENWEWELSVVPHERDPTWD